MGQPAGQQAPSVVSQQATAPIQQYTNQDIQAKVQNDPRLKDILRAYSSGQISKEEAQAQGSAMSKQISQEYKNSLKQTGGQAGPDASGGLLGDLVGSMNSLGSGIANEYNKKIDALSDYDNFAQMLASDPTSAAKMASDTLKTGDLTKGLFGAGGIQEQAQGQYGKLQGLMDQSRADTQRYMTESDADKARMLKDRDLYLSDRGLLDEDRNALMGRDESYGLKDSDLKAYGQASDEAARLFGAQEQNLAEMLASRGLAGAPSGIAASQFSGLLGNKNEQLAKSQQQIAQNRINTAQQLAQARMNADLQRAQQSLSYGDQGLRQYDAALRKVGLGQSQQGLDAARAGANNAMIQGLGGMAVGAQQGQQGLGMQAAAQQYQQQLEAAQQALQKSKAQQDQLNEQFWQEQKTRPVNAGDYLNAAGGQVIGGISGGLSKGLGGAVGGLFG